MAGLLAGYCGSTRRSYATDLFAAWCEEANLELFGARRAHLELFGRWMDENGRMRSTVARRLSTLASFYRYCEQEGLAARNPAVNVRRPKVDYESRTLGLDRNELGASSSRPGSARLGTTPWPPSSPSTACASPKRWAPTSSSNGATRTVRIPRKGGKHAVIPLAPRTSRALDLYIGERATGPIFVGAKGGRMDRHAAERTVKRLARRAGITKRISPHSLRHSFITAAHRRFDAGVPLRDVQDAASHADPRTTMRYDRGRGSLDRHVTYIVATFLAGASR